MSDTKYEELLKKHPDAVVLHLRGTFYTAFGDSAIIIAKLAGYKITKLKNNEIKVGFPTNSLNKVISFCYVNKINVVAYVKDEMVEKQEFEDNQYESFLASIDKDKLEYAESKQNVNSKDSADEKETTVTTDNKKQYTHFIQGHGMTLDNAVMEAQNSINELISFGKEIVTLSLVDNLGPNGIFHVQGIVVYKQGTGE